MGNYSEIKRDILGEILYDFRKENGYIQQEIAEYLDIDRSTYAKYETTRKPELDVVIQLAALYGVSLDEFLGGYRESVVKGKKTEPFSKAASPENGDKEVGLSLEELRLLNLFRKSIRKNEIIKFARLVAAEDSETHGDTKE